MRGPGTPRGRALAVALLFLAVGGAGVLYLLWVSATGEGIPCLIRRFTGLLCGSCGITRSLVAVLHLDFGVAFALNPLWLFYVLYIGWIVVWNAVVYIRRGVIIFLPYKLWVHIAALSLAAGFGILRNFI